MDEYEFSSHWNDVSEPPTSVSRCLVTDGDLVITATYIGESSKYPWLFTDIDHKADFDVIGWMNLPRPMKKPEQVSTVVSKSNLNVTD